jgi:beta-lactamase class D
MVGSFVALRALIVVALVTVLGCAHEGQGASSSPTSKTNTATQSCFLLYELGIGEIRRSPAEGCTTRISPESTFKVPHALAALDSGVVSGPNVTFAYKGAAEDPPTWARDHNLATAMRYSVVWYFQRIATMLGPDREHAYLAKLGYGNEDTSSGVTTFWLDGSLRISPEEQEKFLVRLYEDALPVSRDAMHTVREMLVQPPGVVVNAAGEHPFAAPWPDGTVLGAKTGRGDGVAWLVGSVRRDTRSWIFVSSVVGASEADPLAAVTLAATSLRSAHVL